MSVPEQMPYQEFIANGATVSFPLNFDCEKKQYLIVTIDDVEDYNFQLVDNHVLFNIAPAPESHVKILRNTPAERSNDYQIHNNSFRPSAVNYDFDRIWWKLQELGVADWILSKRIDALKTYVDLQDDELKSFLIDEIRKQGVALDQLNLYYDYLIERISKIAVEKGWDASLIFDGNTTQHEINKNQLNENNLIKNHILNLESYIVYAEKYGSSLNEAMSVINTAFSGKRVRIYVPSDFPVTATVNLNIDCDLNMSTLQVKNDIDVIFEPQAGWSGSTTPCDVYINHKSCRIGWNLKKKLGVISLNKMRFLNVGNEILNTSAQYWTAFSISIVNIKRIDLYEPSTISSFVVPNAVIGDATGTNRNIVIDGEMKVTDLVSDINIHNHVAIDLLTSEDSDALVVSTGSMSVANTRYNIDIYGGYSSNVGKRQYKFMLPNNPSGIRLHGTSIAIGNGTTYCALDMYGNGSIEADGMIIGKGFMIGINSTESVKLIGPNFSASFDMYQTTIAGNQVRALNQTGGGNSDIDIYALSGIGGAELFVNGATHKLRIQKCKHTSWLRTLTAAGDYILNSLEVLLVDPVNETISRSAYLIAASGNNRGIIRNIQLRSTSVNKQQHFIQSLTAENLEISHGEVFNDALTGSFIRMVSAKKIKLRDIKAPSTNALVRLEGACDQVLMDQCVKPSTNLLYYDVNSNSTNLIEINTQIF